MNSNYKVGDKVMHVSGGDEIFIITRLDHTGCCIKPLEPNDGYPDDFISGEVQVIPRLLVPIDIYNSALYQALKEKR